MNSQINKQHLFQNDEECLLDSLVSNGGKKSNEDSQCGLDKFVRGNALSQSTHLTPVKSDNRKEDELKSSMGLNDLG